MILKGIALILGIASTVRVQKYSKYCKSLENWLSPVIQATWKARIVGRLETTRQKVYVDVVYFWGGSTEEVKLL